MTNASHLIQVFNHLFRESENTILIGGAPEPLYLPADTAHPYHRIFFREDYFASALHEIAHWCLAGKARRQLEDYGYWYKPDGRDPYWQAQFEAVEVKPQAIECLFSKVLNFPFQVSVDNLLNPEFDKKQFAQKVEAEVRRLKEMGLPKRAAIFIKGLEQIVQTHRQPSSLTSDS